MRTELFYNPFLIIERIGEELARRRRFAKLKRTPARSLNESQIDSLEFLELSKKQYQIKTIYDIGANRGSWTQLAKSIIPHAVIHAFEPIPEFQETFLQNTKELQNVFLHKTALGSETKDAVMNIAGDASSFFKMGKVLEQFPHINYKGESEGVKMTALDEYIKHENLPYPDLMKLDVEGYELEVLKSGYECMSRCKYLVLEVSFIERHVGQPLFPEVTYFLSQYNYKIEAFCVNMPLGKEVIVTDVLFVRDK